MGFDDACAETSPSRNHVEGPADAAGESSAFDAAVVITAAGREIMNARIAALQACVDQAYRQLIDARAEMMVAAAHGDAEIVASAKDYVDEVKTMFEHLSTANVAEMTATIEQGFSNL